MRVISLRAACEDKRLLGASIDWRPRQLEVLEVFGGGAMVLCAAGRQGGKSTIAAATAIHHCVMRPDLDGVLPRGRVRYVLVSAPKEDQAREFVTLAAAMIDASGSLRPAPKDRDPWVKMQADRIDFALPNGARTAIRALPANARSVRGMSASLVLMEEAAHYTSETLGPANDRRMAEALIPSMTPFGDVGQLIGISTPYGQTGWFYEMFHAAQAGVLPNAVTLQMPTWVLNPALDNDEWKNARIAEIGIDSFLQEYGAEFVVGGGQFFDLREIDFENRPAAPGDGVNWVAGFDPAFHGDHFGVALVGVSRSEPGVLLVGVVDGIKPSATKRRGLGPRRAREDATLEKVLELIAPYEPRIVSDQHQPDAIRAFFGRQGMSVQIVNLRGPAQTAAFTSMRARLMDGSLRLWDHPQLVEELRRVRARESSEAIVLPHFGGSHCDVASALCLATWSHRGVTDTPGWVPGPQVYKPVMSGLMGQSGAGERWVDPDRRVQGGGESIMNKRF